MFSASPRSGELDADAYLAMVELGCGGAGEDAILEAVKDASVGNIDGMQPGWVPGYDVFNRHVLKIDERNRLVAQRISRPAIEGPKREPDKPFKQEGTAEERKARAEAILRKFRKDDDHAN